METKRYRHDLATVAYKTGPFVRNLNVLHRWSSQNPASQPRAPANLIVYAVADVHGRLDLLSAATEEIAAAAAAAPNRVCAVFLGDYIDRGPDSCGVIAHLMDFAATGVCECVFLRGNHEQILLDMIHGGGEADPVMWLEYGGVETLRSYGVDKPFPISGKDARTVSTRVRALLPPEHLAFLEATRLTAQKGDYLFVHAGLRPDRLVEEQSDIDLLWHRYLDDRQPVHGRVVVHGHTPRETPMVGRWRIGIDTAAYASGGLTVLRLEGEERRFLKFAAGADAVGAGGVQAGVWDMTEPASPERSPGSSRSQSRARARSSGGRTPPISLFTRALFAVIVGGLVLVLAWLYIGRADAGAVSGPAASRGSSQRP
jgi:serine/threonine protein phosphatase 1